MNVEAYQSLFAINQSFQSVLEHLEKLKAAEVLPEANARVCRLRLEEMCAEINLAAAIRLHTREVNSSLLQKNRLELEAEFGPHVLQHPAAAPKEAS